VVATVREPEPVVEAEIPPLAASIAPSAVPSFGEPAASDPRFKELLQDLELVLAQIARLHGDRGHEEIELIKDAVEERDVVPRIHSAVARLSLGDN